jgi:hypothetical protein
MKLPLVVFSLLVCGGLAVLADDASSETGGSGDKSGYNLFKPVPNDLLRPVRGKAYDDVTDPTTVDAGHFQVDGSLFNMYRTELRFSYPSGHTDLTDSDYTWSPRFTAGLLHNLDFEVTPSYYRDVFHLEQVYGTRSGNTTYSSGFGAVAIESKLNLWGNDGGMTALSIGPVLSIPTDYGDVNGGVNAAFALRLPQNFYVKVQSEAILGPNGGGLSAALSEGLSINKSVCRRLDLYAAINAYGFAFSSGSEWAESAGFGAIFKVTRDLQLFGGLNFGLNENYFDYNPRFGVVWRR